MCFTESENEDRTFFFIKIGAKNAFHDPLNKSFILDAMGPNGSQMNFFSSFEILCKINAKYQISDLRQVM